MKVKIFTANIAEPKQLSKLEKDVNAFWGKQRSDVIMQIKWLQSAPGNNVSSGLFLTAIVSY